MIVALRRLQKRYQYSMILLRQMVAADFKLRYQGSVLGYLWSLLRPLALFAVLYVVFVHFLRIGGSIPYYPVYLLLGIVVWNFFSEVTNGALGAIVGRGDLIRKLNFPRYVLVMATAFSALINLTFNLAVVAVFIVATGVPLRPTMALAPLLLVEMFVLALGAGFLLSTLFVRFRDLSYVWEVVLQALFYASPILYPLNTVSSTVKRVLVLNPIAQIIQDVRYLVITSKTETIAAAFGSAWIRLVPVVAAAALAALSAVYFRRRAPFFAEDV
jgi:ABC-2 type transport system permease protein